MRAFSYNKLWKLLIDRSMNRKELRLAAGVSTVVMAKLGKSENVTTDVLLKICNVLDCDISEIMEAVKIQQQVEVSDNARSAASNSL
jgi:DNA-binding Xre family transcriptional regulator